MVDSIDDIAGKMVSSGKGILAADESTGTIGKRFDTIGLENTEDNRRAYRELLLSCGDAMNNYISGVILFEETLNQSASTGASFVDMISDSGAIVGIKVDKGLVDFEGNSGESLTQGLDGLEDRLRVYYDLGARFAKWRAVISIGSGLPTSGAIDANADALAHYARACQNVNMVPIVEPEVQMDKPPADHSVSRCRDATDAILKSVFEKLSEQGVRLEGIVLKPNMVVAGINASDQGSSDEIAEHTYSVLSSCVPNSVAGIAFLSGGQSDITATENLNCLNALYPDAPWPLTFSYGRALQDECRNVWSGDSANITAAQSAFTHRARMNSLASLGEYKSELESA